MYSVCLKCWLFKLVMLPLPPWCRRDWFDWNTCLEYRHGLQGKTRQMSNEWECKLSSGCFWAEAFLKGHTIILVACREICTALLMFTYIFVWVCVCVCICCCSYTPSAKLCTCMRFSVLDLCVCVWICLVEHRWNAWIMCFMIHVFMLHI